MENNSGVQSSLKREGDFQSFYEFRFRGRLLRWLRVSWIMLLAESAFFACAASAVDLNGNVKGKGINPSPTNSDRLKPDYSGTSYTPQIPITEFPLPELTVKIIAGPSGTVGKSGETVDSGNFTITSNPPLPNGFYTLEGKCISPPFTITTATGSTVLKQLTRHSSVFFNFNGADALNASPSEFTNSQINAFVWMERSRDFADYLYNLGAYAVIQRFVNASVNVSDASLCRGEYFGETQNYLIEFTKAGNSCVNFCYSTVVAHEFGHHFQREVQQADVPSGFDWTESITNGIGEGCADVYSAFLTLTPIMGLNQQGPNTWRRDLDQFAVYPGSPPPGNIYDFLPPGYTDNHFVGLILAGCFWDLLKALDPVLDPNANPEPQGRIDAKKLFSLFINAWFRNKNPFVEINESVGNVLVDIDADSFNGQYKNQIVSAFHLHNLYQKKFIRGDVDFNGVVDLTDSINLAQWVNDGCSAHPTTSECAWLTCFDAGDVNNDGVKYPNLADVAYLNAYLFSTGSQPDKPFPNCNVEDPSNYPQAQDYNTCNQSQCE